MPEPSGVYASCSFCGCEQFRDVSNPKPDDDIFCAECGRKVGTFGAIRDALLAKGKAEADKLVHRLFGKKPKWR